jgi:hypothetical protein
MRGGGLHDGVDFRACAKETAHRVPNMKKQWGEIAHFWLSQQILHNDRRLCNSSYKALTV